VSVELGGRISVQALLALHSSTSSHSSTNNPSTSITRTSKTSHPFSTATEATKDCETGEDVLKTIKEKIDEVTDKLVKNIETEVEIIIAEKNSLEHDRDELKRKFDSLTSEIETKRLKKENLELKEEIEGFKTENSELRAEGLLIESTELVRRCDVTETELKEVKSSLSKSTQQLALFANREQEQVVEVQAAQEKAQVNHGESKKESEEKVNNNSVIEKAVKKKTVLEKTEKVGEPKEEAANREALARMVGRVSVELGGRNSVQALLALYSSINNPSSSSLSTTTTSSLVDIKESMVNNVH